MLAGRQKGCRVPLGRACFVLVHMGRRLNSWGNSSVKEEALLPAHGEWRESCTDNLILKSFYTETFRETFLGAEKKKKLSELVISRRNKIKL